LQREVASRGEVTVPDDGQLRVFDALVLSDQLGDLRDGGAGVGMRRELEHGPTATRLDHEMGGYVQTALDLVRNLGERGMDGITRFHRDDQAIGAKLSGTTLPRSANVGYVVLVLGHGAPRTGWF
jgi:hypothetical protein